eukprot:535671_1
MDLMPYIKTVNILNIDSVESTISPQELITKESLNNDLYVVSDVDEELIVLIEFKKIIHLQKIKLYALKLEDEDNDMSQPKQIQVYSVDTPNINFEDIKSLKTNKSVKCSVKKLHKGLTINFKNNAKNSINFQKIKYLAIYITSNQRDTETTYINSIRFHGTPDKHDEHLIVFEKKEVLHEVRVSNMIKKLNSKIQHEEILFDKTDTVNMKKIAEIENDLNDIDDATSCINSSHLMACTLNWRRRDKSDEKNECDSLGCKVKSYLINVMWSYQNFIENQQRNVATNEFQIFENADQYNVIDIINAFHHLLSKHAFEFEEIYNILTQQLGKRKICELSNCLMHKRTRRSRQLLSKNDTQLKSLYFDPKNDTDIIFQQILDTIHCYYCHSFDTGYKLTQQNKSDFLETLDDEEIKTSDYVDDKLAASIHEYIDGFSKLIQPVYNKFCSALPYSKLNYNFGFRFFYWDYYKNNLDTIDKCHIDEFQEHHDATNEGYLLNDFYVQAKYKDFKNELLFNHIYVISLFQWNNHLKKATQHKKNCTFQI